MKSASLIAAASLVATPAYACGPSRGEAMVIFAIAAPIFLLLASPLCLFALDVLRMPFGFRPGRRGALVRAVLGAGGAAVGFWGSAFGSGRAQLAFFLYGAACAVLLAYSATIARARTTTPI